MNLNIQFIKVYNNCLVIFVGKVVKNVGGGADKKITAKEVSTVRKSPATISAATATTNTTSVTSNSTASTATGVNKKTVSNKILTPLPTPTIVSAAGRSLLKTTNAQSPAPKAEPPKAVTKVVPPAMVKTPIVVIPSTVVTIPPAAVAPPSRIPPTQLKVATSATATAAPLVVQNAQLENKIPAKSEKGGEQTPPPQTTRNTDANKTTILTRQKKKGIRIKYSGLNNSNKVDDESTEPITTPSTRKNNETASKTEEATAIVNGIDANPKKELNGVTLDDCLKFADIDDIELLDDAQLGIAADLNELNVEEAATESPVTQQNGKNKGKKKTQLKSIINNNNKKKKVVKNPAATARKKMMARKKNTATTTLNTMKTGSHLFPCRHCGKAYRWKSTQRRHELVECGGKEPSQQCPYCPYKAKQRGNLAVHIRKHHSDQPMLQSARRKSTTN